MSRGLLILEICRKILKDESVVPTTILSSHPNWSSLGYIELLVALEKEFGLELVSSSTPNFATLAELERELFK